MPGQPKRNELSLRGDDGTPAKDGSLFLWTVIILLLIGFAIACWIFSSSSRTTRGLAPAAAGEPGSRSAAPPPAVAAPRRVRRDSGTDIGIDIGLFGIASL